MTIISRRLVLSVLLACVFSYCTASGEIIKAGARQAGMGFSGVMLSDLWSVSNNPGALCPNYMSAGIFHARHFNLSELQYQHLLLATPLGSGNIGMQINFFGHKLYNEKNLGLAYCHRISKSISAGIKINYLHIHQGEYYGNGACVYGQIGLLIKISEEVKFGIHVFNPGNQKVFQNNEERIPSSLQIGMSYLIGKNTLLVAEVEKNTFSSLIFRSGLEVEIMESFYLRTGFESISNTFTFGFSYYKNRFRVDLAYSRHQSLGFSPHISISYLIREK